jgi:hypothetical protein
MAEKLTGPNLDFPIRLGALLAGVPDWAVGVADPQRSALLVRRHDIRGRVAPGDLLEIPYAWLNLCGSFAQVHDDSRCGLVDTRHHSDLGVAKNFERRLSWGDASPSYTCRTPVSLLKSTSSNSGLILVTRYNSSRPSLARFRAYFFYRMGV